MNNKKISLAFLLCLGWIGFCFGQIIRPNNVPTKSPADNDAIYTQEDGSLKKVLFSAAKLYFSGSKDTLSLSGNTLSISGGNSVNLSAFMDNTDNQALSMSGNVLTITGGNSVNLSAFMDNTDNQSLSLSGNTLSISGGSGVNLSAFLDNTDSQTLSLSGNTLSISGGNGVALPVIGAAGGALNGSYPNPGIAPNQVGSSQLVGNAVDSTKAANLSLNDIAATGASIGQVPTWVSPGKYAPRNVAVDSGQIIRVPISKLVASTTPANGQVLKYNSISGKWEAGTDNNSGGSGSAPIINNVIEAIGSPSNRSDMASCVKLNGDTLLLMYEQFPGGTSDFADYYLVKRYSYDGGATWQARQNVFATTPLPEIDRGFGIPSLLQRSDTTHLVFWGGRNYPGDPGGNYYDAKIYYTRSINKGVTWSLPIKIQGNTDTTYNSPGSDKLVRLASGRLLYTTGVMQGTEPTSGSGTYVLYRAYSDNNGNSWTYGSMGISPPTNFAGESGVFQLRNGRIICTFRTREKWIYASESSDNGATWGTPYPVLPSGNTMHAMKYVPELDAVVAVYNLAPFDANGAWITTQAAERANMAVAMSRDLKSWSNPVVISNYTPTSIVRIEPSFFYDGENLQVFFSPSDSGADNYALHQVTIQAAQLLGTEMQKRTDYIFAESISTGVSPGNNVKPGAKVDAVRANDAGGGTDYDFRSRNLGGDEIRFWDNAVSTATQNEIFMYAKQSGTTNRYRVTANNMTSTVPGLNMVFDKNDGATESAATDLMLNISHGGTGGKFKFYGNGDLTILGSLTEGTLRKNFLVGPTSTAEVLGVTGASNGAPNGFSRFGLGTGAANTYYPYFQSQPWGGAWPAQYEFRQTNSGGSTEPLMFDFVTSAGGQLGANIVLQRWTSAGGTRMTLDQEGDLLANSFVGLLRPVAGTTTLAPDVRISGSLLTTPVAGAFGEYDGNEFYATTSTASRVILARIIKTNTSLDFPSTATGTASSINITLNGVSVTDSGLSFNFQVADVFGVTYKARITATNTVTITMENNSGLTQNPAAANCYVSVIK